MDNRKRKALALILDLAVILCTVYSVGSFWFAGGSGNMQVAGARSLRFYTNLSNIFGALGALGSLILHLRRRKGTERGLPLPAYVFRFGSAVCLTVTFLTTALFLSPMLVLRGGNYLTYFSGVTFYLHFLTPLLVDVTVLRLEQTEGFGRKQILLAVVPTLLYAAVYVWQVAFRGPGNGGWNDFYGFTFGGDLRIGAVSLVVMILFATAVSFGLAALRRKRG